MTRHLALLLALCAAACAAPDAPGSVELRGRIDGDMARKVDVALQAGRRDFTINSSPGGFVLMAALMASNINAHGARLTVNGYCASACSLLLAGVKDKRATASAEVWVHGAFVQKTGQPVTAAADMLKAGGAAGVADRWGNSLNAHRLDAAELAEMGVRP